MTTCPKCNFNLNDEQAQYCRSCGKPLFEAPPEKGWTLFSTIRIAAVVIVIGGWYVYHSSTPPPPPADPPSVALTPQQSGILNHVVGAASASTSANSPSAIEVFNNAAPSVATLYETDSAGKQTVAVAAGFLLDDSTLVTTYHSVRSATSLAAHFADQPSRRVTSILTFSDTHDVALLRLADLDADDRKRASQLSKDAFKAAARQLNANTGNANSSGTDTDTDAGLHTAPSASLSHGDPIVAIGTPEGLNGTASKGILTGYQGSILLTNISINPSNSGGPLLNMQGEVIGILTSQPPAGSSNQLNYALPIEWATALRATPSGPSRSLIGDATEPMATSAATSNTFGPYNLQLAPLQKQTIPFSTPPSLDYAQFTATLSSAGPHLRLTVLHNGHRLFDSGDPATPRIQLGLERGAYTLIVENTSSSQPRALTLRATFAPGK